jgi:hypothetical protein
MNEKQLRKKRRTAAKRRTRLRPFILMVKTESEGLIEFPSKWSHLIFPEIAPVSSDSE